MKYSYFRPLAFAVCALSAANDVAAQAPALPITTAAGQAAEARSINEWLMRMHEASRNRSYVGTFVVSSGGVMSSARIWHVCDGNQQMEKVETLTGALKI